MISKRINDRTLHIDDVNAIQTSQGMNFVPYVVLLTAWNNDGVAKILDNNLVGALLQKGARNFVCVGSCSEFLHDEIDEALFEYDRKNSTDIAEGILTTYHVSNPNDDEDTIEEAVYYFVRIAEFDLKEDQHLLAILDDTNPDDKAVKKALENAT